MGYNPKMSVNPINIDKYTQVFIDCWRRFLRPDQGNEDFVIFDGSFLFHRANDLIQNYDATDEMIAAHLKALLSAMAPYNPLLLYLSSRDVGARLIQARKGRGQATATDAQIASEVERKSRQMQILELLPIKAHIFDISSSWEKAKNEMMDIILEDFWRGRPFQFNAKSKGVIEMAAEKNQDIKRAYDLLQIISKDEKARMLYEAREAELRDQLTRLKVAEDKGRAEGRMEGRAEGMNMGETQKALKIAEKC